MARHQSVAKASAVGFIVTVLAVVLATVGTAGRASACSCMGWTDDEAFANVDVVVTATLKSTELTDAEAPASNGVVVLRFAVDRAFKGAATRHLEVVTAGDSAACGFAGHVGTEYLVFAAYNDAGALPVDETALTTNLCARTRPLAEAAPLPAAFGEGTAPLAAAVRRAEAPRSADEAFSVAWLVVLAAVGLVVAGATVVAVRRR